MKYIQKKRLSDKYKPFIIFGSALFVFVLAAILLGVFLYGDGGEGTAPVEPPAILEGEALKNNIAIAYPEVLEKNIQAISIKNSTGSFGLMRPEKDETFMLYYTDSRGETQIYYPDICNLDADFDYSELYAIEQNDGYKRYTRLAYLCLSLQLAYFEERIELSTDERERARQLAEYGLNEENASTVYFTYLDEKGEKKEHTINIGSEMVMGTGHYFTVDDRNYVYSSLSNDYSYALSGFYSFVNATLVADGLPEDNGQEPYLTTNFYEWVNEKHASAEEKVSEDSRVIVYTDIIVPIDPYNVDSTAKDDGYVYDGYHLYEINLENYKNKKEYERLLKAIIGKNNGVYYDLEDPLSDKQEHITVTLTSQTKLIDFAMAESLTYNYVVVEIESILTEDGEITEVGTKVGDNNLVKVSYLFNIVDGEPIVTPGFCHTVVDLTDPRIPADAVEKFRKSEIGYIEGGEIPFAVNYTKDNASKVTAKRIITEIISIYDSKGKEQKKVAEDSIVSYHYQYEINGILTEEETAVVNLKEVTGEENAPTKEFLIGKKVGKLPYLFITESDTGEVVNRIITEITSIIDKDGNSIVISSDENGNTVYIKTDKDGNVMTLESPSSIRIAASSKVTYKYHVEKNGVKVGEEMTETVDLSLATDQFGLSLTALLYGKTVGKYPAPVSEVATEYYECVLDFVTYNIARIEYFVTSELVVAFRFKNASERDPYYGESLYENLLDDERKLYGLNSTACESIVKILGGISEDSESNTASGISGAETLAVGLTPEVMDKYGLYAYTVYFELPRSIYSYSVENGDGEIDPDALDDYSYYDTLGFTLYFSEEDPATGMRYVASDLYQIVTQIDGDNFIFLDLSFTEFWARRNIMLVEYTYIEELDVEFNMADLQGAYNMELEQRKVYIDLNNKGHYTPPEDGNYSVFNQVSVTVKPYDVAACTPNKLTETIKKNGYDYLSLTELYGGKNVFEENSYDYLGTSNFKELLRLIYFTRYQGVASEAEQSEVIKPENMLMRMKLKISSSAYRYVYEFYRGEDRRVVVRLYQADADGNVKTTPVSDFYVSTFAFKKMVSAYVTVLNGEILDIDEAYFEGEEKIGY